MTTTRRRLARAALALAALAAILYGAATLVAARAGLVIEPLFVDGAPATLYRLPDAPPGPAVVIAHGFAGSQQLMAPFATTLARAGMTAVTFDFLGHGGNPAPLTGSILAVDGATRALVAQTEGVVALARARGDGRIALLGHSMASDIIVRAAIDDPTISASVAVSMFSPAVTAREPRNLLVITGGLEGFLTAEALRAVGLSIAPRVPALGVTYGDPAEGTARRAAVAPGVEHVGVLYSPTSQREARDFLRLAFGLGPADAAPLDDRGVAIIALLAGLILIVQPLARLLPVVADPPAGAGLGWRRLAPVLVVPALATPLILRVVPTDFLPVLVGDYLAAHFLLYGILTGLMLAWARDRATPPGRGRVNRSAALAFACLAAVFYATIVLGGAIDASVTAFRPTVGRLPLIGAILAGTLCHFLATGWATHGVGTPRLAPFLAVALFLASLALAVALDFERLFFLAIIVPVIVPFFLVFGLIGHWLTARTGHPAVGALASASAFALAIGTTFPMLAG